MQNPDLFKRQSGSVLVGVLGLAVVITLAGLGYLQVSTSVARNELQTLEDHKAFLAAESGLLLAARWLRAQSTFPASGTETPFGMPFETQINGMNVYVTVEGKTTSKGAPLATVTAEAHKGSGPPSSTFRKRISADVVPSTFGMYATFFNRASDNWGGFWNRTFNGTFHMNQRMIIHSGNNPVRFTDRVTVANDPGDQWNYGDGAHHSNNYDFGVKLNDGYSWGDESDACDLIFQAEYRANQEKIAVPTELTSLATGLPVHEDAVTLPSGEDQGAAYDDYRPTLEFNSDGSATYKYYSGGYQEQDYANIDEMIFYSTTNINVHGTVNGNATVVSATGKDIVIDDDLVYDDYTPHGTENNGVPLDSDNSLGLVSGRHITFNDRRKETRDGSTEEIYGSIISGELHVNASMLACNDGGTEYWNRSRQYEYDLHFTGNHILDLWRPPTSGSYGANDIVFNHDERLMKNIQPHGFPYVNTTAGLWLVSLSNWKEEDVF